MAADEGDRGLASDASATAKPGLSGAADSGPPGWASADQARSWCHAANLASRLQCHDVSSAQLWLVLDGIFPHGWEHEEAMATLDSENARTLLLGLCRLFGHCEGYAMFDTSRVASCCSLVVLEHRIRLRSEGTRYHVIARRILCI